MATPVTVPESDTPKNWSTALESISKSTAALLLGIYATGFLVVSLHNASFGFEELSPLKPKIMAAGALLLALTAIPFGSAIKVFSHKQGLSDAAKTARTFAAALSYYFGCTALTASGNFLLLSTDSPFFVFNVSTETPFWGGSWHHKAAFFVFVIAGALSILTVEQSWKWYEKRPISISILCGLFLILMMLQYWSGGALGAFQRATLWFFVVGLWAAYMKHVFIDSSKGQAEWEKFVFVALVPLAFFPNFLYPYIKSSWGGGSPVPVVVYFSGDSRILPRQQLSAELLDESDTGLYLLLSWLSVKWRSGVLR